MIGFVTDAQTADIILDGIKDAQLSRGLPIFWTTGSFPIFTGSYAGNMFIPADDELLSTILRNGKTPMDFPETIVLIDSLGGLQARIDLPSDTIIDPNA